MTNFNAEEIKALCKKREAPCVSIYVPTLKGATDASQNFVRFKNLFRKAEAELLARGMRQVQVDKFFEPVRSNLMDPISWHQHAEAFAMFLSSDVFKTMWLARRVPETVIVGERFYTKPLLSLSCENGKFYILAVSQKGVRFFQGAHEGASELEFANMPKGIDEILRQYVGERHVEFHTQTALHSGSRAALYHGQGSATLNTEDKVQEYLSLVDKCLRRHLQNEHAPLVFAGVDYLFPMYKQANTYPNLVDEPITGNPDRTTAAQLHKEAVTILRPRFEQKKQQAIDKFRQFAATAHASADAKVIVQKAEQGAVDMLFIAENSQLWGNFDSDSQTVVLHKSKQPDSEDLLDVAARETFFNNGIVYELTPVQMGDKSPMTAILRW